jgi:hypothetical protein
MTYQQLKENLRAFTFDAVRTVWADDKPAQRQAINEYTESLCNDLSRLVLTDKISEARAKQLCAWLHLYAAKLHP